MNQPGSTPQGAVEGRYLLDAWIEGWGLGEAWQARDKNFRNRPVLVEFLPRESVDLAAERTQELRAQRALKHAGILPVINQGVHEGRPWVTFDGFDGVPLARFIDEQRRARGQVERDVAQELFDKVLDGVIAAHEAATPVLHGCVHPRCVLVKQGALKVVDFGLRALVPAETLAPFLAPELAKPAVPATIASDVYSLGALLAETLLAQSVGDARKVLESFLASAARDGGAQAGRMQRNDIPGGVWDAIARALKREPAARWDTASSMRDALKTAWATTASAPDASPSRLRPATIAMPSTGRSQTGVAPPPLTAFSGPLPPLPGAFQPAPLSPGPPPVAFSGAAPFVAAPIPPPPAPVPSNAWDSPPPPSGNVSDAWSTIKTSGHSQMKAALASAWDSPAPMPPGAPPASAASPWDAGSAHASWEPPAAFAITTPVAGAVASGDDDWEDETRASEGPRHTPAPIAPVQAYQAKLAAIHQQESTMALDFESLGVPPQMTAPSSRPPDDDWKDSVIVVNTSSTQPSVLADDDDDVREPGSRTRVAQPPSPVLDSMATLRPAQRPASIEAFVPRAQQVTHARLPKDAESTFVANSPLIAGITARPATMAPAMPSPMHGSPRAPMPMAAPPLSERTMAIDISASMPIAQTMQAPMGFAQGPRAPMPAAPPAPPTPSKTPIVIAVAVALILIVGALAVVASRG